MALVGTQGMVLGQPVPPNWRGGFRGAGGGVWLVQGELPCCMLLHSPGKAVSSPGLSLSTCDMGTCLTELLCTLGSMGVAFGFQTLLCFTFNPLGEVPGRKLSQITSCLALPCPLNPV